MPEFAFIPWGEEPTILGQLDANSPVYAEPLYAHPTCYDCASRTIIFLLYSLSLALWTVRLLPYLLHALPSPLPYHICVHQYLLMCTLCARFMTASPHRYLMYHCTFCARFPTL